MATRLSVWILKVLHFVVLDRLDDGTVEIGPREGFGGPQPTIILSWREQPEKGRSRLHIDVNATDRDQDAELERMLELGARPADIGQTGREGWHVLADPEGNEFCLLRARLDPLRGSSITFRAVAGLTTSLRSTTLSGETKGSTRGREMDRIVQRIFSFVA